MLPVLTVVLLHGLGERTWTLGLFEAYIRMDGLFTVHTPHWPANNCQMPDECMPLLSAELKRTLDPAQPIVVVGNSMGGVAAYYLPAYGWNVDKAFYVAAPLHGSLLLRETLERIANTSWEAAGHWLAHRSVGAGPFDYLSRYWDLYPPRHSYWTVSPVLPGFQEFDGHVFRSDTVLEEGHALTLNAGSHFSLLYDCRLWNMILGRMLVGETYKDGMFEPLDNACFKLGMVGGSLLLTAGLVAVALLVKLSRAVCGRVKRRH